MVNQPAGNLQTVTTILDEAKLLTTMPSPRQPIQTLIHLKCKTLGAIPLRTLCILSLLYCPVHFQASQCTPHSSRSLHRVSMVSAQAMVMLTRSER